jgi:hypothetical protein
VLPHVLVASEGEESKIGTAPDPARPVCDRWAGKWLWRLEPPRSSGARVSGRRHLDDHPDRLAHRARAECPRRHRSAGGSVGSSSRGGAECLQPGPKDPEPDSAGRCARPAPRGHGSGSSAAISPRASPVGVPPTSPALSPRSPRGIRVRRVLQPVLPRGSASVPAWDLDGPAEPSPSMGADAAERSGPASDQVDRRSPAGPSAGAAVGVRRQRSKRQESSRRREASAGR